MRAVLNWLDQGNLDMPFDRSRVHIVGTSAGGETGLYAGAIATRITGVIASGCVGRYQETIGRRATCPDTVIPGILNWFENDDVLGLCAPRPLLVVSGHADHIYPFDEAKRTVERAHPGYRAYGAGSMIRALPGPGGHRFYPDIAWPAFLSLLEGADSEVASGSAEVSGPT